MTSSVPPWALGVRQHEQTEPRVPGHHTDTVLYSDLKIDHNKNSERVSSKTKKAEIHTPRTQPRAHTTDHTHRQRHTRGRACMLCAHWVRAPLLCLSPTPTLEDVIAARINYESAERYACTRGSAAAARGARELITANHHRKPGALAAGQPERRPQPCKASRACHHRQSVPYSDSVPRPFMTWPSPAAAPPPASRHARAARRAS